MHARRFELGGEMLFADQTEVERLDRPRVLAHGGDRD